MTIEYDKEFSANRCMNEISRINGNLADIKKDIEDIMMVTISFSKKMDDIEERIIKLENNN